MRGTTGVNELDRIGFRSDHISLLLFLIRFESDSIKLG
jgi:hypothetical protein